MWEYVYMGVLFVSVYLHVRVWACVCEPVSARV